MKFNFFKKKEKSTSLIPFYDSFNVNLPEVYRSIQVYESDSDRFCSFDEDCFADENYKASPKKKRRPIPPPKTPPSFFMGILCGTATVLLIAGGITFLSLFSRLGGIYTSVTVPNLTNLSEEDAISLIKSEYNYFDYSIRYEENPATASGAVISQIPKPLTLRKLYGINGRITIKLTVSKATDIVTLPNLIGQNAREVALELKNAGINVYLSKDYSDTVKAGKIILSSHPAGSRLQKNDTVYITESLGKKAAYVNTPSLIGMSETLAIATLKSYKLELNKVIYESSELPLGTVIAQSIDAKEAVPEGSKINLYVSGAGFALE